MAREPEEAPRGHRLVALGAVALLTLATAVAFGRVFTGRVPTLKLVAAAIASTALAALMERRSSLLAAVVSALGLFVAVGWLVFPHSLYYGVPAARTVSAIGRAIGHISRQAATQVAPSPPVRPLFLAALTAAWTAAFSTHALAIRSGSPLLAAIPSVALFTFTGIVVGDGPRPAYAALFLAALFALLFSDGLRRVRQWGPLRPWTAFGKRRLASPTATRGARRVTVAAVGVAILLPGLLPGYRSGSILDVGKGGGGGIEVDPLVSITSSLKQSRPVPLFLVRANSSTLTYWRWLSLDHFDGTSWTTDDLQVDKGKRVDSGLELPSSPFDSLARSAKGGEPRSDTVTLDQEVTILNPPNIWLPAAYRPQAISITGGGAVRYDPTIGAAVPDHAMTAGFTYRVTSEVVEPTFRQLDAVSYDLSDPDLKPYTELPDQTLREMRPIAQQITAAEPTPFRQILAIQDYFTQSGRFTYDTTVPGRFDTNFLARFVTTTRRGFCQQFASAMAVLVRSLGYPARIATGYTPGSFDSTAKAYRVTTANAHAWVEVYFPGYGWIPFEPTPGPGNPPAPRYTTPPEAPRSPVCATNGAELFSSSCESTSGARGKGNPSNQQDDNRPGGGTPPGGVVGLPSPEPAHHRHRAHPVSWKLLALLAMAVLAGAVIVLLPLARLVARRVRLRRAHSPRELVLALYDVFTDRAADVGWGRGAGETLWEYDLRLRRDVQFSDGHLDRLTGMAGRAAYSDAEVTEDQASEAGRDARSALKDIRREAPAYRRIAGWWRPSL